MKIQIKNELLSKTRAFKHNIKDIYQKVAGIFVLAKQSVYLKLEIIVSDVTNEYYTIDNKQFEIYQNLNQLQKLSKIRGSFGP